MLLLYAGIAQLVERNLAKVEVAGSNPVSRSTTQLGSVAEWSCSGLQLRVRRFDSGPSLQYPLTQNLATVGNRDSTVKIH
jgi:hypothetical protein